GRILAGAALLQPRGRGAKAGRLELRTVQNGDGKGHRLAPLRRQLQHQGGDGNFDAGLGGGQEKPDEKEDCHQRRGAAGSRGRKRSRLPCSSHLFSLLGSRLAFPETPRGRRRAPRLGAGRACVIPETARGGAEFPYRAEPSGSAVAVAIAVLVPVEADE